MSDYCEMVALEDLMSEGVDVGLVASLRNRNVILLSWAGLWK